MAGRQAIRIQELSPSFRSASPLQISNFWRQWKRYPDSRLWLEDGSLRHNQTMPDAPGLFRPSFNPIVAVSVFGSFFTAYLANELIFKGKKSVGYEPEYVHTPDEKFAENAGFAGKAMPTGGVPRIPE
eukprot:CAMPEP_0201483760 /NCGR_PEP_ID=MMETSP0151_2-20130828/7954_1 /ASSEMBLY_ACC=CAM_ASM_000257 /TAXON_ID=200890 /ORGANISM="Paramoeba atlantica, Strain 621/1 / CCAP 1560/9" /LENGTH=127 /DNA_ID=CAMNT_0047867063 /DNA_START=47 /DNA_END=430 /DNA_ORIENTATION=+